ncbi:hypothetical protein BJX64DRAFT_288319 [Aspergillus heterothallicus]
MARLSLLTLASCLAFALALPQPQNACTTVCRPVKPECPEGQEAGGSEAPTGSEGCWGCCEAVSEELIADNICTLECRTEKPECPAGEAPTGSEGCWGCCQPIESDVCLAVCVTEKPECPEGEAPTGEEGCWGCCEAVA